MAIGRVEAASSLIFSLTERGRIENEWNRPSGRPCFAGRAGSPGSANERNTAKVTLKRLEGERAIDTEGGQAGRPLDAENEYEGGTVPGAVGSVGVHGLTRSG